MRFSVVVPLYNKENCIRMTLESVKKQSFKDYEVIVVDDGSTDRSLEEARKIKSENITIIHQQNQGVSVARNTGILHAQGQYIAFLDADDEWEPDYLKTIDHLIEKYPESDMYVTAYRVDMGNGKSHYSARLTPATGCLESYWLTYQYAYDFVWTSATVIRTSAVLKAGLFRPGEKIGQDLDLWSRVARNNPKVAYSSEVCVNYHRMAEANARTRVKVAKADAFIKTTVVPLIILFVINLVMLVNKLSLSPLKFLRRDLKKRQKKRRLWCCQMIRNLAIRQCGIL